MHRAALEVGERPLDWKPEVCWQLPLRRVDETDDHGHVTSTLREWKRRDWGAGGFELLDRDTEAGRLGDRPVFRALRDEIVAMVGETPYQMLVAHLDGRTGTLLPHPALRRH